MAQKLTRVNFDAHWLADSTASTAYTRFHHRPVLERADSRARIKGPLAEAIVDHHVAPEAVAGVLERRGYAKANEFLTRRLPADARTRTGNFGEVLASEHLRQRYGYEMPVFKLRYCEHPNMPMRGEDLVAFRLDDHRTVIGLCVGEAKTAQAFSAQEVRDAHERLRVAYHPHPVSLCMISNLLHDRGDPLAEQIDAILERLSSESFPRENWIFIVTGNRPRDPFSDIEALKDVVEHLSCVNNRSSKDAAIRPERAVTSGLADSARVGCG
jgi:hypothetical protein